MTPTVWIVTLILLQTQNDCLRAGKIIDVKLNSMKYAGSFPVTINNNNTISLFDTGTTISCMSK